MQVPLTWPVLLLCDKENVDLLVADLGSCSCFEQKRPKKSFCEAENFFLKILLKWRDTPNSNN